MNARSPMSVDPAPRVARQLVHRSLFEALTDLSRDPLWLVDASGTVVTCNSAFQRWWKQVTGHTIQAGAALDVPVPSLADVHRRALAGRSVAASVRVIVAGIERTYTIETRPADDGGAAFTARETPAEGGAERDIEPALLHLFASSDRLDEMLTKGLAFLCATDGWDAATVWRVEEDVLRARSTWFESDAAREKLAPRLASVVLHRGEGPPGRAWQTADVVWIPDMLDETVRERAALGAAAGLRSVVAAPLVDDQRVTGVLELYSRVTRAIDEPTRGMLLRTGKALARMIERRILLEQIESKGAEWLLTVDSIGMPIFLVAGDLRIVRVNRTAHHLAGLQYNDLVGRPLHSLGAGEPWKTLCDVVAAVRDSGISCTAEVRTDERTWDVTANPLVIRSDRDERVVVVMRDVTELLHLQDEVRRGEQLAAMGELVAGVAHEVKNPLFGMTVTLDLLDQQLGERAAEVAEMTGALRKWIDRLRSLTDNLLAYGRTWTTELTPGDLGDVLTQAVAAIEPLARDNGVGIELTTSGPLGPVLLDATRLVLVFENLLANAVQHSPTGSTVHVSASSDQTHVDVTVRDHGPGFQLSELPKIFQPFFTRRRGGTGLGLSVVQRIVEEHGGTVAAANAASGGAIVSVRFLLYSAAR